MSVILYNRQNNIDILNDKLIWVLLISVIELLIQLYNEVKGKRSVDNSSF